MAKQKQKKKKIKNKSRNNEAVQIREQDQGETLETVEELALKENSRKFLTIGDTDDTLEWYAEWPLLRKLFIENLFPLFTKFTTKLAKDVIILVAGCGNSKLSENLYDAGYHSITSVDSFKVVIMDMLNRNVRERPEMKWRVMDMTQFKLHDESFDVVLDKGVLDALMEFKLRPGSGNRYLSEVKRVLKAGGIFICFTLAESHVLDLLFSKFRLGWIASLHAIGQEPQSRTPELLTFAVVFEKDSPNTIADISLFLGECSVESHPDQAREIYQALEEERKFRTEYFNNADVAYSIEELKVGANGNISMLQPGRRIKLILGEPGVSKFIYSCFLLDAKQDSKPFKHQYVNVIIPQLRARDWLYNTERGQWFTVRNAKAARVVMVFLDSSNSIFSKEAIQADLHPLLKQLAPRSGDNDPPHEILILTESDGIKKRDVLHRVISDVTGPIIVEDVMIYERYKQDDPFKENMYRRLTFERTMNLVQSEALLLAKAECLSSMSHDEVSRVKAELNYNYLRSRYHVPVVSGILLTSSYLNMSTTSGDLLKTVVVGLGGGLLPMFMKKNLPTLKIEVVELDPVVLDVAREYFGFEEDERLKVHIADGIQYVRDIANSELEEKNSCKIDILIVDADSSNPSFGLTCPGESFVDESFLLAAKESLSKRGMLVINLISRSSVVKGVVRSRLKKVFENVFDLPNKEKFDIALFAIKVDSSIPEESFPLVGQTSKQVKEFWSRRTPCMD